MKSSLFLLILPIIFSAYSAVALSQSAAKEICFNINIITKNTAAESEANVYKRQKDLLLHQVKQTQLVFDKNRDRNCPELSLSKGILKQISWNEARQLSLPVDRDVTETLDEYLLKKFTKATNELKLITKKINKQEKLSYRSFKSLHPGRAIVKAENALHKLITRRKKNNSGDSENLKKTIANEVNKIKTKLDSYGKEDSSVIINNAGLRINKYEKTDQLSASTWNEGVLTFWNDLEAQHTSVELKNLLRLYRTTENQCLDIYVIPNGKTLSSHNKEANKNGRWTSRGGAAISTKNFPRTTNGRGHAILLTYNTRKSETRLAHELVHLLLDSGDPHAEKQEKDLMHEHSKGGTYLDEMECDRIRENLRNFYGGQSIIHHSGLSLF